MATRPQHCDIDPYVMSSVYEKVRKTKKCYHLTTDETDELEQELIVHALEKTCMFNSKRSQWKTYVDRILVNKIKNFLRNRDIASRRNERCVLLSECNGDYHSEVMAKMEGKYLGVIYDLMAINESVTDNIDFRIDVGNVLARLLPVQRKMCCLLVMGYTFANIAHRLKMSRDSMRYHFKKIRRAFILGGFAKKI